MKSYKFFLILILSLLLCGCSTVSSTGNKAEHFFSRTTVKKSARTQYAPTNPRSIMLTAQRNLNTQYKTIGSIIVARHNFVGIKRQQADINSLLQSNASKIGGNAVIDIHNTHTNTIGKVIKFV